LFACAAEDCQAIAAKHNATPKALFPMPLKYATSLPPVPAEQLKLVARDHTALYQSNEAESVANDASLLPA
jgi:hypothetical protein